MGNFLLFLFPIVFQFLYNKYFPFFLYLACYLYSENNLTCL